MRIWNLIRTSSTWLVQLLIGLDAPSGTTPVPPEIPPDYTNYIRRYLNDTNEIFVPYTFATVSAPTSDHLTYIRRYLGDF